MEVLGFIVSPDGLRMDPKKVKAILEWPQSQNVKHIQQFLGHANYYRRFIHEFSAIAHPLHELLIKNNIWEWTENQEFAFNYLKHLFTFDPILVQCDPSNPLRIEGDSSGFATAAILSMLCKDGLWRPCAYISKSLSPTEQNYDIYDREMLAIIRALEEWHHYLEGASHPVDI